MKRVILAIASTISGLIMLLSFKTEAISPSAAAAMADQPAPTIAASAPAAASTPSGRATASGKATSSAAPTPTSTPATSRTIAGSSVDTRYGPVQVQITVTNGKITAAQALVYPQNNPRDQQINAYAVPQLNSESIAKNSANIDMVSGATYTSNGYIASLQSALDKL